MLNIFKVIPELFQVEVRLWSVLRFLTSIARTTFPIAVFWHKSAHDRIGYQLSRTGLTFFFVCFFLGEKKKLKFYLVFLDL